MVKVLRDQKKSSKGTCLDLTLTATRWWMFAELKGTGNADSLAPDCADLELLSRSARHNLLKRSQPPYPGFDHRPERPLSVPSGSWQTQLPARTLALAVRDRSCSQR